MQSDPENDSIYGSGPLSQSQEAVVFQDSSWVRIRAYHQHVVQPWARLARSCIKGEVFSTDRRAGQKAMAMRIATGKTAS